MILDFIDRRAAQRAEAAAARLDGQIAIELDELTAEVVQIARRFEALEVRIEQDGAAATRCALRRFVRHAASLGLAVSRE